MANGSAGPAIHYICDVNVEVLFRFIASIDTTCISNLDEDLPGMLPTCINLCSGFLMAGGISRQPYGAVPITELLNQNLAEHKFRFHTDVEKLFTRLALERACYVSQDFNEEYERCLRERESFVEHIDLSEYDLPENTFR
jgi:hypothetical protein